MVVKEAALCVAAPFGDASVAGGCYSATLRPAVDNAAVADALVLLNPALEVPEESRLLSLLANVLEAMVDATEQREHARLQARLQGHDAGGAGPQLTVFHGLRAPPISIEAYLLRIAKYAKCSPACFVHAMVHMLKLAGQDASFAPTRLNVHRLVLTGVLISAKFLDDRYFNNAFYAKVGGVSTAELNRLELEMLQLLDFQLSVTPEQLVAVLLDAQSGRLVAQMAAAYASACGMMANASLDAAAVLPCMGLAALPHHVPAAASGMSWDAATGASACGLAAAAAAAAAAHSAQHVAAMLHQQQMLQQLAAVQRKRRNSVDMLEGADFRPRAYHRASLEVVAMAQ